MTETTNLFTPADNQEADPLSQLVGDGKKFKTPVDLAKGKLEADNFINQLKDENKQLRDDLSARQRMEELLERIETSANQRNEEDPHSRNQGSNRQPDLDTLLEQKLSEFEDRKRKQENIRQVKTKLAEMFGAENLDTKLKARVAELQLDEATVSQLAAASPTAALKLLGTQSESSSYYTPPSSSVSLTSGTRQGTERTEAYYNDLKKQNYKLYWSDKVQVQMHDDAVRLGEKFFM